MTASKTLDQRKFILRVLRNHDLVPSMTPAHTGYSSLSRASSFKKLRINEHSELQIIGNKQDISKLVIMASTLSESIQRQSSSKTIVRELAEGLL